MRFSKTYCSVGLLDGPSRTLYGITPSSRNRDGCSGMRVVESGRRILRSVCRENLSHSPKPGSACHPPRNGACRRRAMTSVKSRRGSAEPVLKDK